MHFTKMQGIGNDYIYVNCFLENVKDPSLLARKISDRHFGVGSDGLVLICPSNTADFEMRMFNADGSESEMCGNAVRCIGKYVYERGMTLKNPISLKTGGGIKTLNLNIKDGKVFSVRVDMGEPILQAKYIPVLTENITSKDDSAFPIISPEEMIIKKELFVNGKTFLITCVSMGNPHCVIFIDDEQDMNPEKWGPVIEKHPFFPKRVNVEFAKIIDRKHIRMRVWERGAGETMACGTGACATLTAACLNGLSERKTVLELNGGNLDIEWDESTGHVFMTGPAEFVFDGEWPD